MKKEKMTKMDIWVVIGIGAFQAFGAYFSFRTGGVFGIFTGLALCLTTLCSMIVAEIYHIQYKKEQTKGEEEP